MTVTRNTPKKRSVANTLDFYPVGEDGNLLRYVPDWNFIGRPKPSDQERGIFWRENTPFPATLTLQHIFHGQSAANFVWTDTEGGRWPMFLGDLEELICFGSIIWGQASGTWQVRKRGQNYGLAMVPEGRDKTTQPS